MIALCDGLRQCLSLEVLQLTQVELYGEFADHEFENLSATLLAPFRRLKEVIYSLL